MYYLAKRFFWIVDAMNMQMISKWMKMLWMYFERKARMEYQELKSHSHKKVCIQRKKTQAIHQKRASRHYCVIGLGEGKSTP